MPYRAVLFDVGGPLDTEIIYERVVDEQIRESLAAEGVAFSDEEYAAANAHAVACFAPNAYAAIIWRLAGGRRGPAERAFAAFAARNAERNERRGGFELREGIPALLETLVARGLKLGLAANQPLRTVAELDRQGIGHLFSHREVSAIHGYRKPDVRLFLRACKELEVEPAEVVMVGDRVDNDIAPAKLLGMGTVLLRTGRHIEQQPRSSDEVPDAEVHDVAGMERALLDLIAVS